MSGGRVGTDDDARLMSWENFRSRFLDEGLPVSVPVVGDPAVIVFADAGGSRIGLETPVDDDVTAPRSSVESITVLVRDGRFRIETADADLFQPVFAFLLDVSNRIQLDGKPPATAFNDALASWRRLLISSHVMSDELQLGLAGELVVLERLIRARGADAVEAWTGPDREAHDFRLDGVELEVKTTGGELRRHLISRLDQLVASPGLDLYLVSIQLAAAGAADGWTLPDQVATVRGLVAQVPEATDLLEQKLSQWGWRDADAPHYPRRRRLRTPLCLVPVDEDCPRIVPSILDGALGDKASRVDDVGYRVNVEGLGVPDGEPDFQQILPGTA